MICTRCSEPIEKGERYYRTGKGSHHEQCQGDLAGAPGRAAFENIKLRSELEESRIENAQLCEKLAAAQRSEDIPGLAQRAAKAETKLAAAGGLLVAAMNFVGAEHAVFGGPAGSGSCSLAAHDALLQAARSYVAARNAVDDNEEFEEEVYADDASGIMDVRR